MAVKRKDGANDTPADPAGAIPSDEADPAVDRYAGRLEEAVDRAMGDLEAEGPPSLPDPRLREREPTA